jgi:hypothetical protein
VRTQKCWIHSDRSPGKLLKFQDGGLKFVLPSGAQINVMQRPDGSFVKRVKLTKKQRRKLVVAA